MCLGTKCGDIAGKHQADNAVCVPVLTPDRAEKRQNGRRMKDNGDPMFTLTGQDRHGVGVEVEPLGVLRSVRTEYGKEIRKEYENGKLDISRHDFLKNEIRQDGVTNTLSTVQKDNLLAVKSETDEKTETNGIHIKISDELTVYAVWYEKYQCYIAIRRLTPKECWRLQGWTDDYFEKAQFVNSDSQLYKQAGNGVTVPVIQTIAERMSVNDEEQ